MDQINRCIFHIPNHIDNNGKSGSSKRPIKMIEAFQELGYTVDIVMGYGKERKKQINAIKKHIKNGVKYDFMYSESSTMPTILTERNHLPIHPFLDFSFMKYCKKNGIKIALFYRDIYWKFEFYKKNIPFWQRIVTIPFYKYDLGKYGKLLDIFYLPSEKMKLALPEKYRKMLNHKIDSLPPGCEKKYIQNKNKEKDVLNIFYVGGISEDVYNFDKLIEVVSKEKGINLKICCRENEWEKVKSKYKNNLISNNIQIVHLSGEALRECYEEADICSLIFEENAYRKFAMPIKMFEYLSYNKPIIATKGTAVGEFVERTMIGWTVDYNNKEIETMLLYLKENKEVIERIKEHQKKIIQQNLWLERAKKVIKDLKGEGE